jgi:hypothetical protein
MPCGFAKNTSTHTRHRRATQATLLSFDVDCLLGRSKIMLRGIKKSRGKRIHVFTLMPRGKSCFVWTRLNTTLFQNKRFGVHLFSARLEGEARGRSTPTNFQKF